MEDINKIIDEIIELKFKNLNEEANILIDKIIHIDLELIVDYSLDIALLLFENGRYKEALKYFKKYLEEFEPKEEIINGIIDAYYKGNETEYIGNYKQNVEDLKNYEYYYGEDFVPYNKVTCLPLWFDDEHLYYLELNEKLIFCYTKDVQEVDNNNGYHIIFNDIHFNISLQIEKDTFIDDICYKATKFRTPIYLIFDNSLFQCLLLNMKFNVLFIRNRIFIYNNINFYLKDNINNLFKKKIIFYSYKEINDYLKYIQLIIKKINYANSILDKNNREIELYYKDNKYIQNIIKKNPKVLIITTEFSTILKYHSRYLNNALNRIGLETFYLEIKFNKPINNLDIVDFINNFKPDIIITINWLRKDIINISDKIVFLTWLQDIPFLRNLKNSEIYLEKNDFILNHFITDKELYNLKNISSDRFIDAPICSDEFTYKKYELTKEEKEKYSCDICLVAHNSDIYEFVREKKEINLITGIILEKLLEESLNSNKIYFSKKEINEFLNLVLENFINDCTGSLEDLIGNFKYIINVIKEDIIDKFNYTIIKVNIVDTLINAGFKNIKLWGREWSNIERFKPYAMGEAKNGEELSKIFQSSKIVLGCNNASSIQSRVFETFLSGGFFINCYIDPNEDISDIRKYFKEDEEMVFFRTKEDLINKVKYYLENDEERKRMSNIGREISLREFTYTGLANRFLNYLQEYYKNNYKEQ